MLFGLNWRAWAAIAGACLLLAVLAFLGGAKLAWDARARLAAAEHTAELEAAKAKAAKLQADINAAGASLAETTHARESAIDRASARARENIDNAAATLDPHALYLAWADARERVWRDAGLAPGASADPGAGGFAPGVPGDHNA